ncbi:MAG: hypothetical protein M1836_000825 [Candelina mexicana]|nr:MAG: hypothetical protein M1836_000825 [Candelina mexicana]
MGRTQPTKPAPVPKPIRAKTARYTIHKTIPALLSSNPRGQQGVQSSELITSPAALPSTPLTAPTITSNSHPISPPLKIRILHTDTLTAASSLCSPSPTKPTSSSKPHNPIAILNMASPLRPGGGVLNGVTSSQEESLCLRTTLYPSLHENFYRLPDIGGVWTPDVLVFRDKDNVDLPKDKRYYVDVVSAAMLRFPDTEVNAEGEERYVEEKDREMMILKMTAVMRILAAKGVKKVVLGAWGCGAYKNPIGEITRGWKKVLVGGSRKGREIFGEVEEVVFAIAEWRMVEGFRRCFGDVCREEEGDGGYEGGDGDIVTEREGDGSESE